MAKETTKIKTNGDILYKAIHDKVLKDESRITLRLNNLSDNKEVNQSIITTALVCGIGIGINELDDCEDIVIFTNLPTYDIEEVVAPKNMFRMTYNNSGSITVGELRRLFENGTLRADQEYYLMIVTGKDKDQSAINSAFSTINNYMIAVLNDDNVANSLILESRESFDVDN